MQKALRGEGMPLLGQPWTRGNLFVSLIVDFPEATCASVAHQA